MNDRLFGIFEDKATAQRGIESLVGSGMDRDHLELRRVIEQESRGLTDTDRVHSLIHAPTIEEGDPVADDAGTLILIVAVPEQDDEADAAAGPEAGHQLIENLAAELKRLGATDTQVVRATPGLDL